MMDTCHNGHSKTGDNVLFDERGNKRCKICRREAKNRSNRKQNPDGLEHLYGPVPPKDYDLIDGVVLWRIAKEGKSPRKLTRGEGKAVRQLGLYKDNTRDFIKPTWEHRHYENQLLELRYKEDGLVGESHVIDIENQVLFSLSQSVN